MPRFTHPPSMGKIAYLPRARRGRFARGVAAGLCLVVALAAMVLLAGPASALLLRLATILLTVALVAGLIAVAAFRIGISPHARPGGLG